jgi:small neutral amino acid transporter SnatA (MarC family)
MSKQQTDKYIFYVCLTISIALFIGGFFCPPLGIIDGSVLTAGGILLGFATLAVAGQNLARDKDVTFKKGDMEISVEEQKKD